MKRIITYIGFITASMADAALFLTSNDYIQLGTAILLYMPLVYVAFKLFPRKSQAEIPALQTVTNDNTTDIKQSVPAEKGEVEISDINKRVFLKLLGATGLSFLISSLFSRRFDTLLGQPQSPGVTSIKDPLGNIISPAKHHPTDNYKISEVDYGVETYYGFIDENDNWFIMKEDINAGTYRYIKGETGFTASWNSRQNLSYDLFNKVFTAK